jgi:hypothetical protein
VLLFLALIVLFADVLFAKVSQESVDRTQKRTDARRELQITADEITLKFTFENADVRDAYLNNITHYYRHVCGES